MLIQFPYISTIVSVFNQRFLTEISCKRTFDFFKFYLIFNLQLQFKLQFLQDRLRSLLQKETNW